jgi:PAS domain S-box-containing protein
LNRTTGSGQRSKGIALGIAAVALVLAARAAFPGAIDETVLLMLLTVSAAALAVLFGPWPPVTVTALGAAAAGWLVSAPQGGLGAAGVALFVAAGGLMTLLASRRSPGTADVPAADISRAAFDRDRERQQDLENRVAEFETLLKVIPIGIAIATDRECRNIRVNPSFASALALAPDANASKTAPAGERPTHFTIQDAHGRGVPDDQLPMQVAAREGREVIEAEITICHADGRIVRLLEYAAPLLDAAGQPRGSVGAFIDISERRRLEQRARGILESLTDAFYLLDPDWRYAYANQRALDYYAMRADDLLGRVIWDLFPTSRGSIVEEEFRRAVNERVAVRFEYLSPVSERWVELHAYPSAEGLSVYVHDVTDRKRAEARDSFLVRLDDATRSVTDPGEITATATRLLGEHLGVNRCAYIDAGSEPGTFVVTGEYCAGLPAIAGPFTPATFGAAFEQAMRSGEAFNVSSVENDPRLGDARAAYEAAGIRALACVPLLNAGGFAGGMMVHRSSSHSWRSYDVDLLRIVSNRCWESLERARLTRGLVRQTRLLTVLADSGTRLLGQEQPQSLIESLFDEAGDLLDIEVGLTFLLADDGPVLRLTATRGVPPEACELLRELPQTDPICGSVVASRRLLLWPDHDGADAEAWPRTLGVRAFACLPLISGSTLIGTLLVGSRRRSEFAAEDVSFLRALSDQFAAAYARSRTAAALRESEERLVQALAIAELGTFDTDLETGAMLVNEPGRAIYGWTPDEPITFDKVQTHFDPSERDRVLAAIREAFLPGGPGSFEIEQRIIRTTGQPRWIRVRGRVVFEHTAEGARPVRCLGTYLDVTERREADERREQLLENEQAARVEAERVIRMKDEFLATLSHELRTPLNAILGWSQLLRRRNFMEGDVPAALDTIDRNARAQAQLIDDLLDMNRIVSGKIRLDMQPIDLTLVVGAAVESILPTATAKRIRLDHANSMRPAPISGDPARLLQVAWNLLNNAVKFTPPGGTVEVDVTPGDHDVTLQVHDSGIGIAPEFIDHVFERFRQQDASTTRRHGGLGLGLSIVKQLVELHGGTVHVTSPGLDCGSTFTVVLPATAPADGLLLPADGLQRTLPGPASILQPGVLAGVRVLVVDDEHDARELLRRALQDAGAAAEIAGSAEQALDWLRANAVDVLVSDIGMPDVDGFELLGQVRRLPGSTGRVPAIALTAYARPEDRERALASGYAAHLPKPVRLEDLLAAIAGLTSGVR